MIITTPEIKKFLDDYDIVFATGFGITHTIDKIAGDTITIGSDRIDIHIVAKPSPNNPDKVVPPEDITIFLGNVVSIQHRTREVLELTPEQKEAWYKTWQELTTHSTVQ